MDTASFSRLRVSSRKRKSRTGVAIALMATLRPASTLAELAPSPSPTPAAAGGCEQGGLASVTNRPGLGRAVTINGSPCVVPLGEVVFEGGYRNQVTTAAGTSWLTTYPSPVVRFGVAGTNEIVFLPPLGYSFRTGTDLGGTFVPASGIQDAGVGFKHNLRDRAWMQDALEVFVTLPTGYPAGAYGFTFGVPTYLLGYSASFALSDRVGLTTTQNFNLSAGTTAGGAPRTYFSYQPSLGFSYALSSRTSLLLQDQLTSPAAPGGPTGNRGSAAIQQSVGSNAVVDVEFEQNFLPLPGYNQHAFGAGLTLRP
jgi:hypothetical protein